MEYGVDRLARFSKGPATCHVPSVTKKLLPLGIQPSKQYVVQDNNNYLPNPGLLSGRTSLTTWEAYRSSATNTPKTRSTAWFRLLGMIDLRLL